MSEGSSLLLYAPHQVLVTNQHAGDDDDDNNGDDDDLMQGGTLLAQSLQSASLTLQKRWADILMAHYVII